MKTYSFNEIEEKVLNVFPNAELDMMNGEIIIRTNLFLTTEEEYADAQDLFEAPDPDHGR